MAKRLAVKTGTYQKDGQTKGEYVNLGVIMNGENGEYLIIDPAVSLSGCLAKQNIMNHKEGKQIRSSVMVSVFDDNNSQSRPQPASNTPPTNDAPFEQDIPF